MPDFDTVEKRIDGILGGEGSAEAKLAEVCDLLRAEIAHYDWVGFYIVADNRELALGPYAGAPTEHTRIPFGRGICGQAAQKGETFVGQDVSAQSNYLSCSAEVKAEIVVPVFREGIVVGEIDIDSHRLSPFTDRDRRFLESLSRKVAGLITSS